MSSPHTSRLDPSRHLSIYDGAAMAGFVVIGGGCFHTFSVAGAPIGTFDNLKDAMRSAPRAEATS